MFLGSLDGKVFDIVLHLSLGCRMANRNVVVYICG